MRMLIMISLMIGLTACGKVSNKGTGDSSQSSASTDSAKLSQDQLNQIQNFLSDFMFNAVKVKQQTSWSIGKNEANVTSALDSSANCPHGGTVELTSNVTGDFTYNIVQGTMSGDFAKQANTNGSLVFHDCRFVGLNGENISLDGTINVTELSENSAAAIHIKSTSTYTFTGVNKGNGNLHVVVGSDFDKTCNWDYSSTFTSNGSLNITDFSISGNSSVDISGTFCGQTVDTSQQL